MKTAAKTILRAICLLAVLPMVLLFRLQAVFFDADRALSGWSQALSLLPGNVGVYLRHAFYRCCLGQCGADACIGFGTIFSHSAATIGQSAYIGNYCSIGDVQIESDVLIASHVSIMNGTQQHGIERLDIPVREQQGVYTPITIGMDSWIGERAIVAADVGKHCVVGAGALVLSPIPDYAIAVGVPARVIGDRREAAKGDTRGDPATLRRVAQPAR